MLLLETRIKLRALFGIVTSTMELKPEAVRSKLRHKELVMAKQIFVRMAYGSGFDSEPRELAKIINRDRSTIYTSLKTANDRYKYDPEFRDTYNRVSINGGLNLMNIDKQIKEVHYNPKKKSLVVDFADGSKYGEVGEIAKRTFAKIQESIFKDGEVKDEI